MHRHIDAGPVSATITMNNDLLVGSVLGSGHSSITILLHVVQAGLHLSALFTQLLTTLSLTSSSLGAGSLHNTKV